MPQKVREEIHGGSAELRIHRVGSRYECENPALLPPGAWVGLEDGRLYRSEESKSLTSIRGRDPFTFIKVGDNPNIPVSQARTVSADHDVEPHF